MGNPNMYAKHEMFLTRDLSHPALCLHTRASWVIASLSDQASRAFSSSRSVDAAKVPDQSHQEAPRSSRSCKSRQAGVRAWVIDWAFTHQRGNRFFLLRTTNRQPPPTASRQPPTIVQYCCCDFVSCPRFNHEAERCAAWVCKPSAQPGSGRQGWLAPFCFQGPLSTLTVDSEEGCP